MKLTDEMRAALMGAIGRDWDAVLVRDVHAFEAGYRMGLRDMRERAAKVARDRWDATCGCAACCEDEVIVDCVRSLPIEDANG